MVQFLRAGSLDVKLHSQAGQDLYAWEVNARIPDGTFIDIGCNDPIVNNNTYSLELIGWRGVSVDIENFDYSKRKCQFIRADARNLIPELERFMTLLAKCGKRVDYLSMDADDATFDCLERLVPFYKFNAITVEHDLYRLGPARKQQLFEFLSTFGYQRDREDVLAPETPGMPWSNQPFEDWYSLP